MTLVLQNDGSNRVFLARARGLFVALESRRSGNSTVRGTACLVLEYFMALLVGSMCLVWSSSPVGTVFAVSIGSRDGRARDCRVNNSKTNNNHKTNNTTTTNKTNSKNTRLLYHINGHLAFWVTWMILLQIGYPVWTTEKRMIPPQCDCISLQPFPCTNCTSTSRRWSLSIMREFPSRHTGKTGRRNNTKNKPLSSLDQFYISSHFQN